VKTLRKDRNVIPLLVFFLLMFVPMILEFIYLSDFASALQYVFPYWRNRSTTLLLSDVLFLQGGVFIFFGALIAGVILYNAWQTNRSLIRKYISSIWNVNIMEAERRSQKGFVIGLILIGAGITYIIVGIIVTT
jgi:hypothetical protein